MGSRSAWLLVVICGLCVFDAGEAYTPLKVNGQGGFWNQIVVGKDKAFNERIGGLTIQGSKAVASLVDRETPMEYNKRWDLISQTGKLAIFRGMNTKLMSLDGQGNAIFVGKMKVDGVLRVKNLDLQGTGGSNPGEGGATLVIGTEVTSRLRLGSSDKSAWIQMDQGESLVFNPKVAKANVKFATTMFSEDEPKHTLDVKGDLYVKNSLKVGVNGLTTMAGNKFQFAMGGGWTSEDPLWISSLQTKPVQFGGAVFGTKMGVGIECADDFRLQVHNGHFVVSASVGEFLKGLTTYVTPQGSYVKAYDYSRKKLQPWRITGTKILLNPDQKEDGRVCIGCDKPEHHLQSEGNMYVNGNVFVNKHLHVKGHMHIDKIISPNVLIHSKIETPEFGRGLMLGNDLPNKFNTKTNLRVGYNKEYAWMQSHAEVPLTLNPIGGSTCIGCTKPAEGIDLQVGLDAYVSGELFVATLKKTPAPTAAPAPAESGRRLLSSDMSGFSAEDAKASLKEQLSSATLDVTAAWASASKIVQHNHAKIAKRNVEIERNEGAIASLERQVAMLN